jgi:inner membrane protein
MDNLTHTLTGVMLARAGLDRLTTRGLALVVIAANAPDIDAVSIVAGTDTYFHYHRWATHSLAFAPVLAILPVLAVAAITRTRLPWFRAWLVSLIAILSHLSLDFTNPYGIRLWLPFSGAWPSLDITHVIDIWIWAILLLGFFWPILSGLVSSEIGAKRPKGQAMAIAALCALTLYDTARYFLHQRAIETLQSRLYDGAAPRRVVAFPQSVTPLSWNGWIETERAWLAVPVDLTREFDPKPLNTYYRHPESHHLIAIARALPVFQELAAFAKTPYWRILPVETPSGGRKVELIDLRFGRGDRLGFTATAVFDSAGRLTSESYHY